MGYIHISLSANEKGYLGGWEQTSIFS